MVGMRQNIPSLRGTALSRGLSPRSLASSLWNWHVDSVEGESLGEEFVFGSTGPHKISSGTVPTAFRAFRVGPAGLAKRVRLAEFCSHANTERKNSECRRPVPVWGQDPEEFCRSSGGCLIRRCVRSNWRWGWSALRPRPTFAVMLVLMVVYHVVCAFLGINPSAAFSQTGLDLTSLAVFSLVYGMTGGFISLLLSKTIAKFSTKAQTITGEEGEAERWLVETVRSLAERANVKMPEVAIYPGVLPGSLAALGAVGGKKKTALFATHPSLEDRIEALERLQRGV